VIASWEGDSMKELIRVRVLRFRHAGLIGAVLLAALPAVAIPTAVVGVDTPGCDVLVVPPPLVDELGTGFPPGELIGSGAVPTVTSACLPDAPPPNALVSIINLNAIAFSDLWYVADPETGLTNVDGLINGMLAFKIDAVGVNVPLVFESILFDGIFAPGETWSFIIQDYASGLGLPPFALGSVGVPSPGPGTAASSGSIIAVPIPEPASAAILGLGLLGLSACRRRAGVHRKE
jgi:hypothetical protein